MILDLLNKGFYYCVAQLQIYQILFFPLCIYNLLFVVFISTLLRLN